MDDQTTYRDVIHAANEEVARRHKEAGFRPSLHTPFYTPRGGGAPQPAASQAPVMKVVVGSMEQAENRLWTERTSTAKRRTARRKFSD